MSNINSFDGMLRPGNFIDVLVGMDAETAGITGATDGSEEVIFPVIENVKVLATGVDYEAKIQTQRRGGIATDADFSTATLDVFPEQAAVLKSAEEAGRLIAVLRNRRDKDDSGFDSVQPSQLMDLMRKARNAALARASTDVVVDANGNVLGRVVGNTVYDAQGNIVGTVDENSNAVDADGNTIGRKISAQVAVGNDGKKIGTVVGDKVYDDNGNLIGRVVDGKVVSLDGKTLGSVADQAVDANGNVIGNVVGDKVYDADGNVIARVDANGNVVDLNGNTIGRRNSKLALDKNGNVIGRIVGDKVLDEDGNVVAVVDSQGRIRTVGPVTKRNEASRVVLGKDGKPIGRVVGDKVLDANGNVVGTVNADGTVTDLDGNVLQTAKERVLLGKDGKPMGTVVGDKVYDANGNVIATVDADGTVRDLDGNTIDAEIAEVIQDENGNVTLKSADGTLRDENGNTVGFISGNELLDAEGNVIGTVDENGNYLLHDGEVIGTVADGGQVASIAIVNCSMLGRVQGSDVVNASGVPVASINAAGEVVDERQVAIGAVLANVALDANGEWIRPELHNPEGEHTGYLVGDSAFDLECRPIGQMNAQGVLVDMGGAPLDLQVVVPGGAAGTVPGRPSGASGLPADEYHFMRGGDTKMACLRCTNTKSRTNTRWHTMLGRSAVLATCIGVLLVGALPARAEGPTVHDFISMFVGEVEVIEVGEVERIAIGSSKVISTRLLGNGELVIVAEEAGNVAIHLWGKSGWQHRVKVQVLADDVDNAVSELRAMLRSVNGLQVRSIGARPILEGNVAERDKALVETVQSIYPDTINLTRISNAFSEKMVYMHVQIIEFNTSDLENLGIRWQTNIAGPTGAYVNTLEANNVFAPAPPIDFTGDLSGLSLNDTSEIAFFGIATQVNSRINYLVSSGDALLLAEPRLSARSGGEAEFLVGGEIPVVTTSTVGTNVEYKAYGIKLNIQPEADANGNIAANVGVEVSAIDPSVSVDGQIAFRSRATTTDVIMKDGETLVISGLMNSESSNNFEGVKWLSKIPILGKLFRNRDSQSRNSELVIFVTPTLIDANHEINHLEAARREHMIERFNKSFNKGLFE